MPLWMSSRGLGGLLGGRSGWCSGEFEDLAGHVSLEAADGFASCLARSEALLEVVLRAGHPSGAD